MKCIPNASKFSRCGEIANKNSEKFDLKIDGQRLRQFGSKSVAEVILPTCICLSIIAFIGRGVCSWLNIAASVHTCTRTNIHADRTHTHTTAFRLGLKAKKCVNCYTHIAEIVGDLKDLLIRRQRSLEDVDVASERFL